jgi:hypothetical protein
MEQIYPEIPANELSLIVTFAICILLLALPRRHALVPVIMICCYMTMGQSVVLAGFHFTMIRLLIAVGWLRVLVRGELRRIEPNDLDAIVLCWAGVSFVSYLVLWRTGDALIYKLGGTFNILASYFLFRMLLLRTEDVIQALRAMAILVVPLAGMMLLEKSTGRNPFAVFGGVSEFTAVRDGVLRCQGPFSHPILAGTFGATVLPLLACLWLDDWFGKLLATIGIASAIIIGITSGSSGPILALLAGALGLAFWRWRTHTRLLRRGLLAGLVSAQLVMKAPVWFLLARVDIFSGSTGFHRAMLIDSALRNLGDWWLLGTKSTLAWADEDQGLFDVTNQYIQVGADGGLLSMMLFIWIIVVAFKSVGLTWRLMAELGEPLQRQFLMWGLGAALLAHVISYISVSYFDQNVVNWYLLLAMIATMRDETLLERLTPRDEENSLDMQDGVFAASGPSTWLLPG